MWQKRICHSENSIPRGGLHKERNISLAVSHLHLRAVQVLRAGCAKQSPTALAEIASGKERPRNDTSFWVAFATFGGAEESLAAHQELTAVEKIALIESVNSERKDQSEKWLRTQG